MNAIAHPWREIRARYDDHTITVYQAYRADIAEPAVAAGAFVAPFSFSRMTWIKPSFLWMMYRCGWATKPGQERVLAVQITRDGFEEILRSACLSHYEPNVHVDEASWRDELSRTQARVQWDPERTMTGAPLPHRSLQLGITGTLVERYAHEWITTITDITADLAGIRSGSTALPVEEPYPLSPTAAKRIGASL